MFAAHFRTKGILNNDKMISVRECLIALWYAKNLLLKDVAYGVAVISVFNIRASLQFRNRVSSITAILHFLKYMSYNLPRCLLQLAP